MAARTMWRMWPHVRCPADIENAAHMKARSKISCLWCATMRFVWTIFPMACTLFCACPHVFSPRIPVDICEREIRWGWKVLLLPLVAAPAMETPTWGR